jgi:NAD(P)-dependent dehydrogenase (short-subunit alcohol dehydrogenase family)
MQNLERRVYLVTGGTGIAAASADLFARHGATVFIVSLVEADCEAVVARIHDAGGHAAYAQADLTFAAQAQSAIAACVSAFGKIDGVFNVVGISGRSLGDGPIHECSEEGWDSTLEVNVKSMFLVCRAAIRQMLTQPVGADGTRGAILNMASVLAFSPSPAHFGTHAYAASKGAIVSMSQSMAAFYAPNKIRVNVVAPAVTRTPMSARAQGDRDLLRYLERKQPLAAGLLEAADIAQGALFLLSEQARMITGQVLTIDGGWCVSESAT